MNKVILMGRLTRDPDVRYSAGENAIAVVRYSLAVERKFKRDGEQEVDFISCAAFGKNGEFAEKYLHKGMKIAVVGRLLTGKYTKDNGETVYTTEVAVEEHHFCERKSDENNSGTYPTPSSVGDGFMNVPDGIDEELPFN